MKRDRQLPSVRGTLDLAAPRAMLPALATHQPAAAMPQSDWQRYIVSVIRHKWLVLAIVVLGTALGAAGTRLLGRQYTAKSILVIETATQRAQNPDVISAGQAVEAPGWLELVGSNAVLDSVVRQLRLFLRPGSPDEAALLSDLRVGQSVRAGAYEVKVDGDGRRFTLTRDGEQVQQGTVGDSVGASVGLVWAPTAAILQPGREIRFGINAPYEEVQSLAHALKVKQEVGGNFLRLSLKGENAAITAATLNAITQRVVTVAADLKRTKFEELENILGGQFAAARTTLDSAEEALKDFRVRTAGQLRGRPGAAADDPALARSLELQGSLDEMRRSRRQIDDAVAQAQQGNLSLDAVSGIAAVRTSQSAGPVLAEIARKQAELRALRQRYTDEAAPVVALRGEITQLERSVAPEALRAVASEMSVRERQLAPRVSASFGYLRQVPVIALQESRLEREVTSAEELFTNVRQRYESARLALVSSLPDVRVLDNAVEPQRPMANLAPLLVLLAFLTSLAIAVVAVTVKDSMDPRLHDPEQVTAGMKLPILGAVPHVGWRTLGDNDGALPLIEALRVLRLRVLHAMGGKTPLALTVTSPAMGEGKSFVSVNLALSFADAGYKTVLIDADLRRGQQHRALNLPPTPGLTDVLSGTSPMSGAVKQTAYASLSFLPAGTRMQRAPELLQSQELTDLIDQLRTVYDVVIVDSPPLTAGVDPLQLGTVTGNLLLVLRSGRTDLPLAMSKLEDLGALPVRTIGAVLNDVRGEGAFKYYTYDTTSLEGTGNGTSALLGWSAPSQQAGGDDEQQRQDDISA